MSATADAPTATGFRLELRDSTRAEHERLDALASQLDVSQKGGLRDFFLMNAVGFQTLAPFDQCGTVAPLVDALRRDLHVLTGTPTQLPTLPFEPADHLAVAYIVAGSRLGTQVLARRWRTANDPSVQAASCYFTQPPDRDGWQKVCGLLDQVPSGSARAAQIKADTRRIYHLFESALRLARSERARLQTNRLT